jgi:hypothetical protein
MDGFFNVKSPTPFQRRTQVEKRSRRTRLAQTRRHKAQEAAQLLRIQKTAARRKQTNIPVIEEPSGDGPGRFDLFDGSDPFAQQLQAMDDYGYVPPRQIDEAKDLLTPGNVTKGLLTLRDKLQNLEGALYEDDVAIGENVTFMGERRPQREHDYATLVGLYNTLARKSGQPDWQSGR